MKKNELKPFDKVLGRADHNRWRCDFFCYYDNDEDIDYPFICVGDTYAQCIPYEGNEHLAGTTDDYVEPWQPKDGDFVFLMTEGNTRYITIHHYTDKNGRVYNHAQINPDVRCINILPVNDSFLIWKNDCKEYRPATDSEKQLLLSKLAEIGKDWDESKKEIVEYRWKPKHEETYWFINPTSKAISDKWYGVYTDEQQFEIGNCFRTREEAQAMADKFKELLKGGKE